MNLLTVFHVSGPFSPSETGYGFGTLLSMEKDEHCSGACRKELAGIEALEKSKDQEDKAKLNKLFT
jgi:hypothetical protein